MSEAKDGVTVCAWGGVRGEWLEIFLREESLEKLNKGEEVLLSGVTDVKLKGEKVSPHKLEAIPVEVANHIELEKSRDMGLGWVVYNALYQYRVKDSKSPEIQWIGTNQEEFMKAWMYGYEVVEELFVVKLTGLSRVKEPVYLLKDDTNGSNLDWSDREYMEGNIERYSFTEEEIRKIDPAYLGMKVPVEEFLNK